MMQNDTDFIIRFIPGQQVDREKWDACILSSSLPLIYAKSVYLDGICRHWDALVLDDYEAVMPLPWNRKWFLSYVYSPYFVIGGGVFGKTVTEQLVPAFIKAIPKRFRYIDLDMNEHNFFPEALSEKGLFYHQRRNTWLHLNQPYTEIYSGYHTGAKRKLKKAAVQKFSVDTSSQVDAVIQLYKQHYKEQDSVVARFDFRSMIALLNGKMASHAKTYILSFPDGEIAAFYLLLFDEHFVYWLIGGSTARGKEAGAFYYLTDLVIQDFANTNRIFRFEGSDHEGIYFFNRQYGGQTIYYPRLNINRLPPPFRYLK